MKNLTNKKTISFTIIVLLLIYLLISFFTRTFPFQFLNTDSSKNSQKIEVSQSGNVNQDIKLKDNNIIVKAYSSDKYNTQNDALSPRKGYKVIAVELSIANNSDADITVSTYEFVLVSSNNKSYKYFISDKEPHMPNRPVKVGDTVRGFLTFEIPESEAPSSIIYSPTFNTDQNIQVLL